MNNQPKRELGKQEYKVCIMKCGYHDFDALYQKCRNDGYEASGLTVDNPDESLSIKFRVGLVPAGTPHANGSEVKTAYVFPIRKPFLSLDHKPEGEYPGDPLPIKNSDREIFYKDGVGYDEHPEWFLFETRHLSPEEEKEHLKLVEEFKEKIINHPFQR
jgi:hypothetical protein